MKSQEQLEEELKELQIQWEVELKHGGLTRGKFVTLRTKIQTLKEVLEIE